jgi:hypothetical protein
LEERILACIGEACVERLFSTSLLLSVKRASNLKICLKSENWEGVLMDSDWCTLSFLETLFPATPDLSWSTLHLQAAELTGPVSLIEEDDLYEPTERSGGRDRERDSEDESYADEEDGADENQYYDHSSQLKRSGKVGTRCDITYLLCVLQSEAAVSMGMTPSTFCKRWKEAVGERKWPFRLIVKLDKAIASLQEKTPVSRSGEAKIAALRKQRKQLLAPTSIRVS